jgi:hypothetical protein
MAPARGRSSQPTSRRRTHDAPRGRGHRIVNVHAQTVALQFVNDVDDLGVAQVGQFSLKVRPSTMHFRP